MAKLIIVPQGQADALGIQIGADVIAYYPFEETETLTTCLDNVNNFDGETASNTRVPGYLKLGLPVTKSATKNFEVNKVLDEIPSTKKFCVQFWAKLDEEIKVGEHRTHTIFSKQWTSGQRLFAYFISRLETLQLHIEYTYIDTTSTTRTETTYTTINEGAIATGTWHSFAIQLDLRDGTDTNGEAWYSKYGVYFNDYYAVADTDYFVSIPESFSLTPTIIGGDLANLKLATNDATIDIIVDNLPFASSSRYGLEGVLDEVIIRRNLLYEMYGTTERPRLYVIEIGDGEITKDPEQTSYLPEDEVEVTATPDAGGTFRRWWVASGTISKCPNGTVSSADANSAGDGTVIEIKEDLIPDTIPVTTEEGDYYIKFTSGTLADKAYKITATTAGTGEDLDSITVAGVIDGDLAEDDGFVIGVFEDAEEATVNAVVYDGTETTIDIEEDLIAGTIDEFDSDSQYFIQFTAGALEDEIFRVNETVAGTAPALDQIIVEGDASTAVATDTFDIYREKSTVTIAEDLVNVYVPAYTDGSEDFKIKFTSGELINEYFDINDSVDGTLDTFTLFGGINDLAVGDAFIVTTEENPITVEIPLIDRTIYAEFGGEHTLTVTTTGDGSVTIDPDKDDYGPNEVVTLTAVPDDGWYFAYWETDLTGSSNPGSITMDGNKTVNAVFKETSNVIYISHNDNLEGSDGDTDTDDDIYISHDETI